MFYLFTFLLYLTMLHSRRLTEILRRGRRTLRKSLTRKTQSQDEESTSTVTVSHSTSEISPPLDKVTTSSSSSLSLSSSHYSHQLLTVHHYQLLRRRYNTGYKDGVSNVGTSLLTYITVEASLIVILTQLLSLMWRGFVVNNYSNISSF